MKAILRWFKLISGTQVNFSNSCLIQVNVEDSFVDPTSSFLKCKVGSLHFTYLWLSVGSNPNKVATWKPILDALEKRLGG